MTRLLVTGIDRQAVALLFSLSNEYEVTALVSTVPGMGEQIVEHSATLREHQMPRTQTWARDCAFLSDKPGLDAGRVALARTIPADESLRRAFLRYARDADLIVHTSAVFFEMDERWSADGKPRIYHAPAGPEFPRACQTDPAGPFSWLGFPLWVLESRLVAACTRIETDDPGAFHRWYDCPPEKCSSEWATKLPDLRPLPLRRRSVLLVNDYGVELMGGGGHRRIRALYGFLASRDFEVTLLCFTDGRERRDTVLGPHFRQIAVPKTAAHLALQAELDRDGWFVADVASLLHCMDNAQLGHEFRMASSVADVVVFEHVYLAPLTRLLPLGVPVVYSSQNVESRLKRDILAGHPVVDDLCQATEAAELFLLSRADMVTAVSADDAAHFAATPGAPVHVLVNGVSPLGMSAAPVRNGVVFTGSGHKPNREALEFVLSEVAPALRDTPFYVIGAVGENVPADSVPPNVVLTGVVTEERKNEILASAAVAINPMFSGGGSNVKLPEYFAWDLPVVSTAFGARGFEITDGVHLLIAGREEFSERLQRLLNDEEQRRRLTEAAREYVRSLYWTAVGARWHSLLSTFACRNRLEFSLRPVPGGVSLLAGDSELLFPASESLPVVEQIRWGDYEAEDEALRACTPASPEMERYLALYGHAAAQATVTGGPCSATRTAARILRAYGVSTEVADANSGQPWMAWSDTLHPTEAALKENR